MPNPFIIIFVFLATIITVYDSALSSDTETIVLLPNGNHAQYTCIFNRNALTGFRFLDSSIVALTASGSLLCFDRRTIELQRERTDSVPVTYLDTPGSHSLLCCYADGRITRITSMLETIDTQCQVPAGPTWFTTLHSNNDSLHIVSVSYREDEGINIIFDSRSGRTTSFVAQTSGSSGMALTSFFLEDSLLWLGNDVGEFGGYFGYYNLHTGALRQLSDQCQIYGFTKTESGLLAYGGTYHFDLGNAFIFRLHSDRIDTLYYSPFGHNIRLDSNNYITEVDTVTPLVPVTHIIDDPFTRNLIVQAYSDVFTTDYTCSVWRKDTVLKVRYKPGRRDAIGSYPAITAVAVDPLYPERLLYATASDGFITLDQKGHQEDYTLSGEPDLSQVGSILSYRSGPIFFPTDTRREVPWQLTDGIWESALASRIPPIPDGRYCYWSGSLLAGTPDILFSLWQSNCRKDTTLLFRHSRDTTVALPAVASSIYLPCTVMTPDYIFWTISTDEVERLDTTGRQYRYAMENPPPSEYWGRYIYPVLLNTDGPPWYLIDRYRHLLFILDYRPGDTAVAVRRLMPAVATDSNLCVMSGCPLNPDTLLLATNRGLLAFDRHTQSLSPLSFPLQHEPLSCMLPDGNGNIWLAGRGIWRWTPGNNTLTDLRPIPSLGSADVTALAVWHNRLIITLQRGTILFVELQEHNRRR